jgi:hypothetical protein
LANRNRVVGIRIAIAGFASILPFKADFCWMAGYVVY